ncbi:tautomerase enzyme [Bradyrhizobium sp. WBOS7]|uniref:Tautomerase enzyme n=1 Tax=Bradyrhizobium betae TaxID=244734 RepID=A0AAE9NDS7_9BRAD|nr:MULTISPECIES: tautomerase family protein [Bradyrhizobium]MDD1570034.1 tautomerase enzyme [Bradyrhizobium sp. WBOS1]UUO36810.1 tautomerase enzyme [Bradyrhizobium sp. WBOS01]MDD1525771.1 tautomerase enzyme [Bradyrhizobium sp. WBOS2]MDD1576654.1 tautomerase enzyme [Bradyrhizobium sp. WBOS7]MDD1598966.1 tautomerase enzyme [Bradyrhizobium sp. WBOS16]
MTIITVTAPAGRLSPTQRRHLAESLTDAVLVPELGQHVAAARAGFQVHFHDLPADCMAIGGRLLSDQDSPRDIIAVRIAVMNAAWPAEVRAEVIRNVLARLAEAFGMPIPAPTWWVNFEIIDEGSWGSRGGVLSILQLLESGVFTSERIRAIRAAVQPPA